MKKNDFILIAICLLAALSVFALQHFKKPQGNPVVLITVGGEPYGTYDLDKDQEIDINGSNTLLIKDGAASMIKADCPDKICVSQKPISKDGESIICLPNRVIVTVESKEGPLVDSVSD